MVTMEIEIEENVLEEVERVLNGIGMDVMTAVNIFLRRVVLEKGLPMPMSGFGQTPTRAVEAADSEDEESDYEFILPRTNKAITKEMVEEVWKAFLKYQKGLGDISRLRDDVAEQSGMNSGSAFIYLNILANLTKGEPNTRTLKMKDLSYLMEKIRTELSEEIFQNAIKSLQRSIPYWHVNIPGSFVGKVEEYCKSHQ